MGRVECTMPMGASVAIPLIVDQLCRGEVDKPHRYDMHFAECHFRCSFQWPFLSKYSYKLAGHYQCSWSLTHFRMTPHGWMCRYSLRLPFSDIFYSTTDNIEALIAIGIYTHLLRFALSAHAWFLSCAWLQCGVWSGIGYPQHEHNRAERTKRCPALLLSFRYYPCQLLGIYSHSRHLIVPSLRFSFVPDTNCTWPSTMSTASRDAKCADKHEKGMYCIHEDSLFQDY